MYNVSCTKDTLCYIEPCTVIYEIIKLISKNPELDCRISFLNDTSCMAIRREKRCVQMHCFGTKHIYIRAPYPLP